MLAHGYDARVPCGFQTSWFHGENLSSKMKLKKKKPGATLSETVREDVEWEDFLTYNNVEKTFKHFKVSQSVKNLRLPLRSPQVVRSFTV